MEDIAKAPLNQAHFLDKKADSFAKKQLFEKAIECREKAIEHLKVARQISLSNEVCVSLDNQIASHDSRIYLLREQNHQKEAKIHNIPRTSDRQNFQRASISNSPSAKTTDGISSKMDEQVSRTSPLSTTSKTPEMMSDIEAAIKREILKGDKLLASLVSQKSTEDASEDMDGAPASSEKSDLMKSAIKLPKSVEQVVEELRFSNGQLKTLVGSLFEELDAVKFENQQLKDELFRLRRSSGGLENDGKNGPNQNAFPVRTPTGPGSGHPSAIELHPLEPFEMPQLPLSVKPRVKIPPRTSRISE